MERARFGWWAGALWAGVSQVSCFVYDTTLLDRASDASGGSVASGGAPSGAAPGSGGAAESGGSSGTGGTTSTGGLSGSGGSCSWGSITPPAATSSRFDDFDDNDKFVLAEAGRSGRWDAKDDGSAGEAHPSGADWDAFPMTERADVEGNFALHYVASGFTDWHLVLAELASGDAYDLSAWTGVAFWVRTDCDPSSSELAQLRVAIADGESFLSSGSIDHAGSVVPFVATTAWRRVALPFSAMTRRFGSSSALDASAAHAVVFSPNAPGDLDLWIDDVVFYLD